ncbi:unnamed protein product [Cochlearia groenlandica]
MAKKGRRRCRRRKPSHQKIKIKEDSDFINNMPDEILHRIISFVPTDLAMRSCVLSKRWRHVWSDSPCLDMNLITLKPGAMNQTLISYKAPTIESFHLSMTLNHTHAEIDSWIEFAISRSVQKLNVSMDDSSWRKSYSFPDLFYLSSSLKQLSLKLLVSFDMISRCTTVSWKYLRDLSLICCELGEESIDKIISGCPILEALELRYCRGHERLDLSKSTSVRRLDVDRTLSDRGPPSEIIAPHVRYLSLVNPEKPTVLVDVSSLTEANLNVSIYVEDLSDKEEPHILNTIVLEMLAKLPTLESLTVGITLLQVVSLAELRGVLFPILKVQALTIKTEFARSVIPGIARLLQNSPGLKKLTVHTMHSRNIMLSILETNMPRDMHLDMYLNSQDGLDSGSEFEVFPTSEEIYSMLGCNYETSKLLVSFIEMVLKYAKTLETMIVCLRGICFNDDAQWFQELHQMVETLSHDNNLSIVLKRSNC